MTTGLRGEETRMGFFARDWLDRLLGRRGSAPRSATHADETEASEPTVDDIEEGATAARDEAISDRDRTPMPPPGTS